MIPKGVENIFSIAVALDQSGRLANTIICKGKTIFILNNEATVLFRFEAPGLFSFDQEVRLKANDYEPGSLVERNGKVIFTREGAEFIRTKSCRAPGKSFKEVQALWDRYWGESESTFFINSTSLSLLEESLSHLEIGAKGGSLKIVQRNIFTGTTITLTRKPSEETLLGNLDQISQDFGPVGIRTSDFQALFYYFDQLEFHVPKDRQGYFQVRAWSEAFEMKAIIAWCLYDELGTVEVIDNGRQEPEDRRSEQIVGGKTPTPIRKAQGGPRTSCE